MEQWKPFIIRLPKKLKEKLKEEAKQRDIPIAELIRQILTKELED